MAWVPLPQLSKFQELRQQIKADIKKQHNLYVNKLVGDIKVNPLDNQGISSLIMKGLNSSEALGPNELNPGP